MNRKLAVAIVLAVAGGAIYLLCQKPEPAPEKIDLAEMYPSATTSAEQGRPIVTAIYQFKNRWGLWPTSFNELVPEYLTPEEVRDWHYSWQLSGRWHLSNYIDFPRAAVQYEKSAETERWQLTDGIDSVALPVTQPKPEANAIPQNELLRNFRVLMRRRLDAEPHRMIHYEGQIGWYYKRQHFTEAREACLECLQRWPDHWWPNVMLAMIDTRLGHFEQAEERLKSYIEKKNEFNYYLLLGQFYKLEGDTEKAMLSLKSGIGLPIKELQDGFYTVDQPLGIRADAGPWRASLMAYRAQRYDLAVAICDHWERYRKEDDDMYDASYFTIRAACYLARGEFEKAQQEVEEMRKVSVSTRHSGDDFEALEKAIERRDRSFVYEKDEDEVILFIDYE